MVWPSPPKRYLLRERLFWILRVRLTLLAMRCAKKTNDQRRIMEAKLEEGSLVNCGKVAW